MDEKNVIRVLVVDDHPVWRDGVTRIVQREPGMAAIAEAATGQEALDLFRLHQPDVTLMDFRMPDMDGITAIKSIRAEFPAARIIMMTTYDTEEDIYQGLQAGACGYLFKDISHEELPKVIRKVHSGEKYIPREVAARLAQRMQNLELSRRELQVLGLIAQGLSNLDIGTALSITEGTVKSHVTNILSKMTVEDRTQAVIAGLKRGLLHIDQDVS